MMITKPLEDLHADAVQLHNVITGLELVAGEATDGCPAGEAVRTLIGIAMKLSRALTCSLKPLDLAEGKTAPPERSSAADMSADAKLLRVYLQALELNEAIQRMPETCDDSIDRLIAEHHRLEAIVLDTPSRTAAGLAAKLDLVFYRGRVADASEGTDEAKVEQEVGRLLGEARH